MICLHTLIDLCRVVDKYTPHMSPTEEEKNAHEAIKELCSTVVTVVYEERDFYDRFREDVDGHTEKRLLQTIESAVFDSEIGELSQLKSLVRQFVALLRCSQVSATVLSMIPTIESLMARFETLVQPILSMPRDSRVQAIHVCEELAASKGDIATALNCLHAVMCGVMARVTCEWGIEDDQPLLAGCKEEDEDDDGGISVDDSDEDSYDEEDYEFVTESDEDDECENKQSDEHEHDDKRRRVLIIE
jgi:hypothetical protein